MKIAAIRAFCAFAVYAAIGLNSYAEQPVGEQKTEKQQIEWGFACVPLKDFAKAQAGAD
ncbi:hypothetical protein M8994_13045 [Brucella sp. 21LCYQ03]|nr:hypothetical protein [Brucella sp. 21LCYQ03]